MQWVNSIYLKESYADTDQERGCCCTCQRSPLFGRVTLEKRHKTIGDSKFWIWGHLTHTAIRVPGCEVLVYEDDSSDDDEDDMMKVFDYLKLPGITDIPDISIEPTIKYLSQLVTTSVHLFKSRIKLNGANSFN